MEESIVEGKTQPLARWEMETIINWNKADGMANVYTHEGRIIKQLEKLGFKANKTNDHGGKDYDIPKRWIKIRPPMILSPEEKARRAHILEKTRGATGKLGTKVPA